MTPYHITRESNLSDREIADRAAFIALAFSQDPVSRFMMGDEYKDHQAMWEACCADDLRKAEKIGRIYTTHSDTGDIMAIAVAYDAGHDIGDLPSSEEVNGYLAAQPRQQKAFKEELEMKQKALYQSIYTTDVKRDNVYIHHFAVKDGYRGQGLGSTLVKRVLDDIKAEGYRMILDTSKPMNVAFYQRNGVKLNGEFEIRHYKYGPLPKSFALATE